MTPEPVGPDRARVRLSGGFTLDDAARLARAGAQGKGFACPACGFAVQQVPGYCPHGRITLLHCSACGRGLVIHQPSIDDAHF